MDKKTSERRKYLRLEVELDLRVITAKNIVDRTAVTNLSPLGLRFSSLQEVNEGDMVDMTLYLPKVKNPVHIQGKVVWFKKVEQEHEPSYDIGCEFARIEEDNKNTFLRYFCDLIYGKTVIT